MNKEYKDKYGLISLYSDGTQGQVTQNGALFTVEYLFALWNNPNISREDKSTETISLNQALSNLEVKLGLSARHPDSDEHDSMDNASALLVASKYLGMRFAKNMQYRGENFPVSALEDPNNKRDSQTFKIAMLLGRGKVKNVFNNLHHDKFCFFSWFGRSPGFMGLIDICATGDSTLFRKFSLLVGQLIGCFADVNNTDARKLPYIAWQVLKDRGLIWSLAYKFWNWKLHKDYPNGLKDVYSRYYSDTNHPIHKLV